MSRLRVLGGIDLETDTVESHQDLLRRQKCLALLVYLGLEGPYGFRRRDKLAALFWPDLDQHRARAALRKSVHFLRAALGSETVLGRGTEEIGLDPTHLDCDAVAFREAVDAGRLEHALALYRGDLLDGFFISGCHEFELWLHNRRVALREAAADTAWALAFQEVDRGAVTDGERWAQQALELVCTDEAQVQEFMRVLGGAGDRAAAVRFFERFESLLFEQYELSPSAESRAELERLRSGASAPPPPRVITRRATDSLPSGPAPVPVGDPGTPPSDRARTRRTVPWSALAAVGLVVVALLLRFGGPGGEPTTPTLSILPPDVSGAATMKSAEGFTHAIHERLVPVRGLTTLANYGRADYDPTGKTYREMGDELGADYVLRVHLSGGEGPAGDLVRVDAHLVRTSTEETVWTLPPAQAVASMFELQTTIAHRVVEELHLRLSAPEREALESVPTQSDSAWALYQRASRIHRSGPAWASEAAIPLFEQAVAEDSSFVLAYLGLANAYSAVREVDRAQEALAVVRRLDPDHPGIPDAEGGLVYGRGQYEQAAALWEGLLEERPSDANLHHNVGIAMRFMGRWDDALAYLTRAGELDHFHVNNHWVLSNTLMRMRDYRQAEFHLDRFDDLTLGERHPSATLNLALDRAWHRLVVDADTLGARDEIEAAAEEVGHDVVLRRVIGLDVARLWFASLGGSLRDELRQRSWQDIGAQSNHYYLARAAVEEAAGDGEIARLYYDSVLVALEDLRPWNGSMNGMAGIAMAGLGRAGEAVRLAEEGLRRRPPESTREGTLNLWYLARTLILLNEHDRAVEVLGRLVTMPSQYSKTWLRTHPFFDPLRGHPGFAALVEEG